MIRTANNNTGPGALELLRHAQCAPNQSFSAKRSIRPSPRWEKSEGEQSVSIAPSLTLEPEGRAHYCLLFMWRS